MERRAAGRGVKLDLEHIFQKKSKRVVFVLSETGPIIKNKQELISVADVKVMQDLKLARKVLL